MALDIDTIRSLDASKTYYLANSTGQIKEAGAWQKFKCFFGIGDARQKVQNLIDAVKIALLKEVGESDNAKLTADIKSYDDNRYIDLSASGRSLAEIANRFAAANAEKLASKAAKAICAKYIQSLLRDSVMPSLPPSQQGSRPDFIAYLERAAKPIVDHPPMKELADGRQVLDEDALAARLGDALYRDASTDLVHIAKSERLGCPRFDMKYLDHVFKTLYDGNGVRNDKTIDDLQPALDFRLERARHAGPNEKTQPEVYREYMTIVKPLLEKYADDPDVLTYFLDHVHLYVFRSNGKMRPKEEVEATLAGIRANFNELREAANGSKSVIQVGMAMLRGFHGKPMPPGKISQIAQLAKASDLSLVEKLNPSTSDANDIHKAAKQMYTAVRHIFRETGFDNVAEGENRMQYRGIIIAFLLGRFPPNVLYCINTTLGSNEAAALARDYNKFSIMEFFPDKDWPTPPWNGAETQISKRSRILVTLLDSFKNVLDRMLGIDFQYIDPDKVKNERYTKKDYNVFCDIVMDAKADAQ